LEFVAVGEEKAAIHRALREKYWPEIPTQKKYKKFWWKSFERLFLRDSK
jgi:hypothetical protein